MERKEKSETRGWKKWVKNAKENGDEKREEKG